MSLIGPLWSPLVNLPSYRHPPIKNRPNHPTSYRRLDYIPKRGRLNNQTQAIKQATDTLHKHLLPWCVGMFFMSVCRLLARLVDSLWNVSVCFLWVCVGCLGDCFECLSMGLHGPLSVSVAYSGHSPKLPAHPMGDWSIACGMYRYVFYRCVSGAWEIAAGSLWNVSVCFFAAVYSGLFLQSNNFGTLTLSFVTLDFHLDGVFFRLDVAWNHCPNFFWFAIARSCASLLFFSMLSSLLVLL